MNTKNLRFFSVIYAVFSGYLRVCDIHSFNGVDDGDVILALGREQV